MEAVTDEERSTTDIHFLFFIQSQRLTSKNTCLVAIHWHLFYDTRVSGLHFVQG